MPRSDRRIEARGTQLAQGAAEPPPLRMKTDRGRPVFLAFMVLLIAALAVFIAADRIGALPALNPQTSGPARSGGAAASAKPSGPVGAAPVVTEVMAGNSGSVTTEAGEYTDWIELYNPTKKPLNLAGFALSDNRKKPVKSVLPAWTLDPGEYAIVYADGGKSTASELHAAFKLDAAGTPLTLVDPNGALVQEITCPALDKNVSYAAGADGKWAPTTQISPGFPNTEEGCGAYRQTRQAAADVALNEVMAGNTLLIRDADGDYSDWVELVNPSDKAVNITGWGLSDNEGEPKRWVFPQTVVEPGKYIIVFLSGKNRGSGELHADFKLDAHRDTVLLSNLRGQVVSRVQVTNLKPDESYARVPGSDKWAIYSHPTPGYPNNEEGWNALQPALYADENSPVVINEVMSGNADTAKDQFGDYPDWIELHNRSDKSVDLKGYALTDKPDEPGRWQFPEVTLAAGQYMTVYASGRNLRDGEAVAEGKLHTDFSLGGSCGAVVLTAPGGQVADRCFVPALRVGLSYGRENDGDSFRYFDAPTPGKANKGGYPGLAPDPLFSVKAGVYEGEQMLELSSDDPQAKIYYTLDGSTPTNDSEAYAGPLKMIKPTAIRAITYRDGYLPGNTETQTYIINAKHTLPVISISTTPKNLFDPVTGIYMPGPNASTVKGEFMAGANFYKNTEVPASFEVYDEHGGRVFAQEIGLSMAGGLGLIKNQKTFAMHARSQYGHSTMDYPFFNGRPYTKYKSLVLRANRDKSKIRESVIFGLTDGKMNFITQAYKPYVVYINGQYWGVYNLMEKRNKYMVAQHEGANDPDDMNILKGSGGNISHGGNKGYKELVAYVRTHDMSQQENYDYVAARLDTDSFMDVMINLIYTASNDYYNMQYYQLPGGKWKQIFYDTELTFQSASHETLKARMGNTCNSDLFKGLLKYKPWKNRFIERFAWTIKEIYNPDRVNAAIDKEAKAIEGEVAAMREKFGDTATVDDWNAQIEQLHAFANKRPAAMVKQLKSVFSLTEAQKAMLDDAIQ